MILIEEDFLNHQTCDELIKMYLNSEASFRMHRDIYVNDIIDMNQKLSLQLGVIFTSHLATRGVQVFPELIQGTVWPKGSMQHLHLDDSRTTTSLTSITYLNDDFEGGETYFENGVSVKPKKGKTVFFDGKKYKHGVNKMIQGNRYVCACWYTCKINNLDC